MRMIISPKNSIAEEELLNVETCGEIGKSLKVVFTDGIARHYPLQHLEYYQYSLPKSEKSRIVRTNGNGVSEASE